MKTVKLIEKIQSKMLGEYFALRNEKTSKPFKNPMKSCTLVELNKNDIVIDIGAYIGEYSIYAAQRVKKVISYEASPETFKVLKMNKKENMYIYNKAIVGNKSDYVKLFLSKGIGATNSIVKSKNKAGYINIKALNFNEAIKDATIIKIDVEGAEYNYDFNYAVKRVRGIILEFHPVDNNWKEKANKIMDNIISANFKCLLRPKFNNGWDTNSSFIRV